MTCIEKVVYKPSPENSQWTVAERKAWIDSKIFGLGYAIQVCSNEFFFIFTMYRILFLN